MTILQESTTINLFPGLIVGTYPENRAVDVKDLSTGSIKRGVHLVTDPGNYSFPALNDAGLVIGNETSYYFIGKIDYGYSRKLAREENPSTKIAYSARLIEEGATYISNFIRGTGVYFSNSGGFSLLSKVQDGIKYVFTSGGTEFQKLLLKAKTVQNQASSAFSAIGRVIRSVPGVGDSVILKDGGTQFAQEWMVSIRSLLSGTPLDVVKLHLGDIFTEPIATPEAPIEKMSTVTAQPIKAELMVNDSTGVTNLATINIDSLGNIEIKGTPQAVLHAALNFIGSPTATEPAVHGTRLITWLNAHTHYTSFGPSGVPVVLATPADFCSTKVFIG